MTRVLDLEIVDAYAQRVLATGMAPAVAMAITDRERAELTPLADGAFRVGESEWTPERLHFDTVLAGAAQRTVHSGTPHYRALTG